MLLLSTTIHIIRKETHRHRVLEGYGEEEDGYCVSRFAVSTAQLNIRIPARMYLVAADILMIDDVFDDAQGSATL